MNADESANPFEPPSAAEPVDSYLGRSQSVFDEPHMQADAFHADQRSEEVATRVLAHQSTAPTDAIDHSVWDEPSLSQPIGSEALTYDRWLSWHQSQTTIVLSVAITLGIAIASGIWAVLGAITLQTGYANGWLVACLFAPLTERNLEDRDHYLGSRKTTLFVQVPLADHGLCDRKRYIVFHY